MNSSFDEAQIWIENLNKKFSKENPEILPEIVLCPPSVMIDYIDGLLMENELEVIEKIHKNLDEIEEEDLEKMVAKIRIINLGGQDCHTQTKGAFTGDISAKMLQDCGAYYVILGHSERRQHYLESNDLIAQKIIAAIEQKLIPILCIGESRELREQGKFKEFIVEQLENSLPKNIEIKRLIVAYEPVWSIGSGLVPTKEQIEEVVTFLKANLAKNKNIKNFQIVYGGSVNLENAGEILNTKNVDGVLVGGSSLNSEEFLKIVYSAKGYLIQ